MDKADILLLAGNELYEKFIEKVLSNVAEAESIIPALESSERYSNDFIFRIHVQTARQFVKVSFHEYTEVLEKADDLIERALVLELTELVNLNYHVLGIACKLMGYFEKAVECFMNVLRYEKDCERKRLTSVVYFYLGEIFMLHDDCLTGIEYMKSAMRVLEETKNVEPRYTQKKILYTSTLLQLLYETESFEEMYHHVDVMRGYSSEDKSPAGIYNYNLAKMYYYFSKEEFEEARKVFYNILSLCEQDSETKLQQIKIFCALLWEFDPDPSLYEKELLEVEALPESRFSFVNYALHRYLSEYYEKTGNREAAFCSLKKAVKSIEKEMMQLKRNKVDSFKLVEKNLSIEEDISSVQKKNVELKMVVEEALRNKELAESANRRLAVVNRLGKKLTYSLDVSDIIETVFHQLLENIPLESFVITVKNSKKNQLESIIFYEKGELKEPMIIDYDDEDSAFVETVKTNRFIKIDDFDESDRFQNQRESEGEAFCCSVLFLPLSVENEVLGACSVQHSEPYMYTEEHMEFLEELLPYLTIALNNAMKSKALENEIKKHKKTQDELKEVNQKLELLSSLDSLTQISNRRAFENRILEYLRKAKEEGLAVSIFMFDIDNFKFFNDTYGHLEGDRALKSVATVIRRHFERAGGISARFGGEEFVAAALGFDEEKCMTLGNAIRQSVADLGIVNEKAALGILTVSVGIALACNPDETKKSLIMRWADVSLYQAKRTGKNKVVLKEVNADEEPPEGLE